MYPAYWPIKSYVLCLKTGNGSPRLQIWGSSRRASQTDGQYMISLLRWAMQLIKMKVAKIMLWNRLRPFKINCMFYLSSRVHFAQKLQKKHTFFSFTFCFIFFLQVSHESIKHWFYGISQHSHGWVPPYWPFWRQHIGFGQERLCFVSSLIQYTFFVKNNIKKTLKNVCVFY